MKQTLNEATPTKNFRLMPVTSEPTPTFSLAPYKELDNSALADRIDAIRKDWGKRLVILGHHYQQDEVIAHSDLRGDSLRLSQLIRSCSRRTWNWLSRTSKLPFAFVLSRVRNELLFFRTFCLLDDTGARISLDW